MKARMLVVLFVLLSVAGCASERLNAKTELSVVYTAPVSEDFSVARGDKSSIKTGAVLIVMTK